MPIDPSLGEAFDAACKEFHDGGAPGVRKLIAKRIIAAARGGELDPVRLRAALSGLSVIQISSAASRRADYSPHAAKAASQSG